MKAGDQAADSQRFALKPIVIFFKKKYNIENVTKIMKGMNDKALYRSDCIIQKNVELLQNNKLLKTQSKEAKLNKNKKRSSYHSISLKFLRFFS